MAASSPSSELHPYSSQPSQGTLCPKESSEWSQSPQEGTCSGPSSTFLTQRGSPSLHPGKGSSETFMDSGRPEQLEKDRGEDMNKKNRGDQQLFTEQGIWKTEVRWQSELQQKFPIKLQTYSRHIIQLGNTFFFLSILNI